MSESDRQIASKGEKVVVHCEVSIKGICNQIHCYYTASNVYISSNAHCEGQSLGILLLGLMPNGASLSLWRIRTLL
jgi:hypothetical protein